MSLTDLKFELSTSCTFRIFANFPTSALFHEVYGLNRTIDLRPLNASENHLHLVAVFKAGIKWRSWVILWKKHYISELSIKFLFLQIQAYRVIVHLNAWRSTHLNILGDIMHTPRCTFVSIVNAGK